MAHRRKNAAGVPNKVFNMDSRAGVETILARYNDPDYRARRKAEILRRAGRNEDDEAANRGGPFGRKVMEWKTSIAGFQVSNWMIALGAIIVILLVYLLMS
jgi:hypothetical protein